MTTVAAPGTRRAAVIGYVVWLVVAARLAALRAHSG
jgi:hypothetical protein